MILPFVMILSFILMIIIAYISHCYIYWRSDFADRMSKSESISSGNLPRLGDRLDMDHIKLTFLQYLWGMCFIIPTTFILFV